MIGRQIDGLGLGGILITPFGELPHRLAGVLSLAEQHDWLHRPMSRRSALQTAAAAGLAGFAPLPKARKFTTGSPLIGRQIVFGADPSTQMTLSFALKASFEIASVRVVRVGTNTSMEVNPDVAGVPGTPTRYVRAAFHGLEAGADYNYLLTVDTREVGAGTFSMARTGAYPFRFTAFGDQSTASAALPMIEQIKKLGPSLHLFAGDLSYADITGLGGPGDVLRPGVWDKWIAQNDPVASRIPWMCAPGNHEMEPGFAMHGYAGLLTRVPIGGSSPLEIPVASKFQVGSVGFVGLDTNDVSYEIPANRGWTQGRQTTWLRQTLGAMRGPDTGIDFIVVFMHASPYTSNSDHASDAGIRESWVPLFEKYNVDLVISGHNHCYERTLPIRKGLPTARTSNYVDSSKGTTYVTAGGGGAATSNYKFLSDGIARVRDQKGYHREQVRWILPSDRRNAHNLLSVDVVPAAKIGDQTILRAVAFDDQGHELDRFSLVRSATVIPTQAAAVPPSSGDNVSPWVLAGGGGLLAVGAATAAGTLIVRSRRIREDVNRPSGDGVTSFGQHQSTGLTLPTRTSPPPPAEAAITSIPRTAADFSAEPKSFDRNPPVD